MIQKFNEKIPCKRNKDYRAVYLIVCVDTNDVYIGSTKNIFTRMSLHRTSLRSNSHENKNVQELYNTYGENSFYFKYKLVELTNYDRLIFEEKFINLFKTLNIAKEPTKGGSPNKGRKLTEEWRINLHKNKNYKHSEEVLNKVTNNNKKGACKLVFRKEGDILEFNSWIEASEYFGVTGIHYFRSTLTKYKGWIIEVKTFQKKKVILEHVDGIMEFNSASACDKFLNMWKGATSHYLLRDGEICGFKVSYLESI